MAQKKQIEKLFPLLKNHEMLALDTSVFIYHFKADPKYVGLTRRIFSSIEKGKNQAISTVISLSEILVKPLEEENFNAAEDYKIMLERFPNFTLIPIDSKIAFASAALRAKYKIKTPDALQIAGAIQKNATLFITNDKQLKKIEEIKVVLLSDLLD